MIAIKAFIEQIIYIAIVAVIIELILPKGNTKKYVYVILSLFVLLNVLSPILNIIEDIDMQYMFDNVLQTISNNTENNKVNIEEFSEYKNTKVTENLKKELIKEIRDKLKNMDIDVKDINIKLTSEYTFDELEIEISNLAYLGDKKIEKISNIITTISEDYNISENVITIIEEGK